MKLNRIRAIMALGLLMGASGIHGQVRPQDGALDTQSFFSPNGYGLLNFPAPPRINGSTTSVKNNDLASKVVITPDDRLVIASTSIVTEIPSNTFTSRVVVSKLMGDGSLDRSFGAGTGYSTINLNSTAPKLITGIKLTRATVGGKILIGVAEYPGINSGPSIRSVFVRLNSDGSLDSTYGPMQNGVATLPADFHAYSFDILPDDSVVTVGYVETQRGTADMAAIKLTSNGQVDSTFAPATSDHIARVKRKANSDGGGVGLSVAINPNNQHILVTGQYWGGATPGRLAVGSFTAEGNVDESFGDYPNPMQPFGPRTGLAVVQDFCGGLNESYVFASGLSILVQPDGKVVVAGSVYKSGANVPSNDTCPLVGKEGWSQWMPLVLRLNEDGSLDTGFKLNKFAAGKFVLGYITSDRAGDGIVDMVRQWDGKLVIGSGDESTTPATIRLTRLNTDGSLDNTFGFQGVGLYPLGNDGALNGLGGMAMEGYGIVGVGRHGDRPVVFRVLGNASEISY